MMHALFGTLKEVRHMAILKSNTDLNLNPTTKHTHTTRLLCVISWPVCFARIKCKCAIRWTYPRKPVLHLCFRIPLNPACSLMNSVMPTSDSFTIAAGFSGFPSVLSSAAELSKFGPRFLFLQTSSVFWPACDSLAEAAGMVPETEKIRSRKLFAGALTDDVDSDGVTPVRASDWISSTSTHRFLTILLSHDILISGLGFTCNPTKCHGFLIENTKLHNRVLNYVNQLWAIMRVQNVNNNEKGRNN